MSVATPNPTLVPPSQSKSQSPYGKPRRITFPSATSLEQHTRTHGHTHAHTFALASSQSRTLFPSLSMWERSPSCRSGSAWKTRSHGGLAWPLQGHSSARTSQISTIFCFFFFSKAHLAYLAPAVYLSVASSTLPHHTPGRRHCVLMAVESSAPSSC